MFTGHLAPVSAAFVGLALLTTGLGRTSRTDLSLVRARQFVFLFLLSGTVTLAL